MNRVLWSAAVYLMLCTAYAATPPQSPMTGKWWISVGCKHPLKTAMCGDDDIGSMTHDEFIVEVVTKDNAVCGFVDTEAMGGKRADLSSFVGIMHGQAAEVQFESTWGAPSVRGVALISMSKGHLKWHVTREIEGAYTMKDATAIRVDWNEDERSGLEHFCASHWDEIQHGNTSAIPLHW